MSSSKVDAVIKKLTDDLKKLKVLAKEAEKASKAKSKPKSKGAKESKKDKPKSITSCTNKKQLMLFTVAELKDWLLAKKVEKLSGKNKEELVGLVLKKLKGSKSKSSSSSSSDSESDSESEFFSSSEDSDSDSD
jgi:hypothetical protein